jgi:hypothetical protein
VARVTKYQQVREWILAQPTGSIWTPTAVSGAMAKAELPCDSGTASKVLRALVEAGRAEATQPNPFGARRGGFRLTLCRAKASVQPLLPLAQAGTPTEDERQRMFTTGFTKIQEGLDEIRHALTGPLPKGKTA